MRTPTSSETQSNPSEIPLMTLGKIVRSHGVRGEVRMQIFTAYPDNIPHLESVYLCYERNPDALTPYNLEGVRFHRGVALLKLVGIDDRNQAEMLRGQLVKAYLAKGAPREEGEIYLFELLGIAVYTEADEYLGKVERIIETGANDVFLLQGTERGDVLIPDTDEVVQHIDLGAKKMIITPIPGLLSDDE